MPLDASAAGLRLNLHRPSGAVTVHGTPCPSGAPYIPACACGCTALSPARSQRWWCARHWDPAAAQALVDHKPLQLWSCSRCAPFGPGLVGPLQPADAADPAAPA